MPVLRLASFDTDGLAPAAEPGSDEERLILQALAVAETAADVVALQGVPGMAALEALRAAMQKAVGRDYRHALLIDGNDPVTGHSAVLANLPIVHARSHRTLSFAELGCTPPAGLEPETPVFSSDCLEVAVERQGRPLTLFVCRFTGSPPHRGWVDGAEPGRERRLAEAAAVRRIVEQRFADPARAEWVVLGNLADQSADEAGLPDPNHALGPLLDDGFAVDLLGLAPGIAGDRWSRYDMAADRYSRPDHLLLSPALARRNRQSPVRVVRAGLPYRATRHSGQRYPRIGWLAPAASWHCPVVADLTFSGDAESGEPAGAQRPHRSGGGRPGRAL